MVKAFEDVGKGIVSVGKAIGGAIVTGFTALGRAIVTVATAIGNVIKAVVDFVLSLFACFGFGVVGDIGYTKAFGVYVKIGISASVSDGMGGIIGGQGVSRSIGIGISLALVVGGVMEIGISIQGVLLASSLSLTLAKGLMKVRGRNHTCSIWILVNGVV